MNNIFYKVLYKGKYSAWLGYIKDFMGHKKLIGCKIYCKNVWNHKPKNGGPLFVFETLKDAYRFIERSGLPKASIHKVQVKGKVNKIYKVLCSDVHYLDNLLVNSDKDNLQIFWKNSNSYSSVDTPVGTYGVSSLKLIEEVIYE